MLVQILLVIAVPACWASIGIDVSQSVSREQFECLKENGYKFVIVRAHRNIGVVDEKSAQTIRNARAAGLDHIGAYLLPCIACGDAAQQVIETVEYLKDEQLRIDMLWLDITGRWNNSTASHIQFIDELIEQVKSMDMKFGIYTTRSRWMSITNDAMRFSISAPLWYAHYDNRRSFEDFQAFGGWKQPAMKQFIGDVKECGVVFDRNFA